MSSLLASMSHGLAVEAEEDMKKQNSSSNSDSMQAQHQDTMKDVLTKTIRIQKEMRGRRYRDVAAKLQEAVDALGNFRMEDWPPKSLPATPEWMQDSKKAPDQEELGSALAFGDLDVNGNGNHHVTENGESQQQEEPAEEATTSTVAESADGDDTSAAEPAAETPMANGGSLEPPFDESSTTEPMHGAVKISLAAYTMVLSHPSRTTRVCEMALDCTTTLLNNRYVSGKAGGRDEDNSTSKGQDPPPPSLLYALMQSIAKCSESSSDTVQLGVVKALMALMTSPKCGIHEGAMLTAVRSTFHVYLVTKSPTCKDQAQSALLDMLKSVFNRMEAYDVMVRADSDYSSSASNNKNAASTSPTEKIANGEASSLEKDEEFKAEKVDGKTDAPPPSFASFASQFHIDSYLLLRALCKLSSKPLPGDEDKSKEGLMASFYTPAPDPLALNSKILSLELILAVLEHAGEAFCSGEKFIYAIQNYLCVSLLKCCMSNNTQVAFLAQKIFLILVWKFKKHLKSEIEVFVANIFLRVLESPNSSFEQKALVLEALRALCSDPGLLTQIFLNYDCDMDASNLYNEIVMNLTKLAAKSTATPPKNATVKEVENDLELSLAGVEVLTNILRAFLKALGLPVNEDEDNEDSAATRLRKHLQIDVGLAATPKNALLARKGSVDSSLHGSLGDESSVSSSANKGEKKSSGQVPEKIMVSDEATGKIVTDFEKKRTAERNFELGMVKWNLSIKSGLKYFIDNGFVELDASDIAKFFLRNKDKLDKTQTGEFLGREPDAAFVKGGGVDADKGGAGFYVRVLHHYVDALNFSGLPFDDAIRLFLSGFRLPGEAQKIDRIMEKFAERFTRQNPEVFPSADTAFILGFSVIMLNTDLHNPNIKPEKKMTLESFIRNNRGISVDGGDLPEEFLTGIFNRIKTHPFSLKEDDDAREREKATKEMMDSSLFFEGNAFFGKSAEERKREKFKKEREEMMGATEKLFRKKTGKGGKTMVAPSTLLTDSVSPAGVVKPMFDESWGPLIGTLSQVLECSEDERIIAACLNGFVYAVRVAAHSDMTLARDTFMNSLAKFTFLGSLKEMKHKNIESIRTLLSIAVIDGEYLGESWGPVLQCISQLARLRLFASGLDTDEQFLVDKDAPAEVSPTADTGMFRQTTKAEVTREMEENNGRAVLAAVSEVLIDKVFSSTVNLSARSIAHFIEQLVEVSAMEISGDSKRGVTGVGRGSTVAPASKSKKAISENSTTKSSVHGDDGPRIFSLQRLVEVADFNMDVRPRLAWAQVWEIMANHFAKMGCDQNSMVSMFAIDALRQLSFKFLEKPELSEFNFQRIFLRPFLQIMENNKTREEIRELILRCVDNMIRSMSHNLRSGWKIFFSVLTLSASDRSERINTLGLAILQRLLDEHLHQLCRLSDGSENETEEVLDARNRNANVEDFVGLCRASLSFVQTGESDSLLPIGLSMRALCHTACYADLLAEQRVLPPLSGAQSSDPYAPGYTYEGLSDEEALEMVLWRPLIDGLADGICSSLPSSAGGVGCLVQRGSVLTLRAILLRYGDTFSTNQWAAILKHSIVPAIKKGAMNDRTTVVTITSESPAVTSLDFLADPLLLPPSPDDEGLLMFATESQSDDSSPSRPLGKAELLVEASFADLRHGGDGNLSRAHVYLKKNVERQRSNEPFPDSWVATTAPIAMGMLTDIASEIVLKMSAEGINVIWPLIFEVFEMWLIGRSRTDNDGAPKDAISIEPWQPCEALVRVACCEIGRFPERFLAALPGLSNDDAVEWTATIFTCFSDLLSSSVAIERAIEEELIKAKFQVYGIPSEEGMAGELPHDDSINGDSDVEVIVYTPYGKGRIVEKRRDRREYGKGKFMTLIMNVIKLDSGATLFRPAHGSIKHYEAPKIQEKPAEEQPLAAAPKSPNMTRDNYWEQFMPELKIRCVAAHCLQQCLFRIMNELIPLASKDVVEILLKSLNRSRIVSGEASQNSDLAHTFQEAMFSQWGDGVEEVEEALSNTHGLGAVATRSGSEMFFLTQEAGATKVIIHMLSLLYCRLGDATPMNSVWDHESFAETLLLDRMMEVLSKFLDSERKDGHLIDPNVWRNASESGGKVAVYCTSFAGVVVNILQLMLSMDSEKFTKHKPKFFPVLCSLVQVQSDEIRSLVSETFVKQIGPMIGLSV